MASYIFNPDKFVFLQGTAEASHTDLASELEAILKIAAAKETADELQCDSNPLRKPWTGVRSIRYHQGVWECDGKGCAKPGDQREKPLLAVLSGSAEVGDDALRRIVLLLRIFALAQEVRWEIDEPKTLEDGRLSNLDRFANHTGPTGASTVTELSPTLITNIVEMTHRSMGVSIDRNLMSIYHRGSDRAVNENFIKSIKGYVATAQQCIYIAGRTHSQMLAPPDNNPNSQKGWLWQVLIRRLNEKSPPKLRILVGDGFRNDSSFALFRDDDESSPGQPQSVQESWLLAARTSAIQIVAMVARHCPHADFELQLMGAQPVPYALLLTQQTAFVEHYLPSQVGGSSEVFQYFPIAEVFGSYASLKDDFEFLMETRTGNLLKAFEGRLTLINSNAGRVEKSLKSDLEKAIEYLKDKQWANKTDRSENQVSSENSENSDSKVKSKVAAQDIPESKLTDESTESPSSSPANDPGSESISTP